MPTRLTRCRRNHRSRLAWPAASLSKRSPAAAAATGPVSAPVGAPVGAPVSAPASATSSLRLPVSMPAHTMVDLAIFLAPSLDANPGFLQPSGSDEEPTAILLRRQPATAAAGNDPRSEERRVGKEGRGGRGRAGGKGRDG